MKKTADLMLVSWVSDVEWVRQNENFPRASSFNERGSYEQYFEDDLNAWLIRMTMRRLSSPHQFSKKEWN
jgi:hypothetical protein